MPEASLRIPVPIDITHKGLYVGMAGYAHKEWEGMLYPAGALASDPLEAFREYQRYFPFVEITDVFSEQPQQQFFSDLEEASLPRTMFSVRVNRGISHAELPDQETGQALMQEHIRAVAPLVETGRFYSFIIGLAEDNERSLKKMDYLLAVAETAVRRRLDVHVEFKHKSWHMESVLRKMKDNGIGIVNPDLCGTGCLFPRKSYATSDKGYIRYYGQADPDAGTPLAYDNEAVQTFQAEQRTLLTKTNVTAAVYANAGGTGAVLNAIQNIRSFKR